MRRLFLLLVILFFTQAADIFAQHIIVTENDWYLGIVKEETAKEISFVQPSGDETTLPKEFVSEMRPVMVEVKRMNGGVHYGHIMRKYGDSIRMMVGHSSFIGIGSDYDTTLGYPEITLSMNDILTINYGELEEEGKLSGISRAKRTTFNSVLGGGYGLYTGVNLIFGQTYDILGFRLSFYSGNFEKYQGVEFEVCYFPVNNVTYSLHLSAGNGVMADNYYVNWYPSLNLNFEYEGIYIKMGTPLGFDLPNDTDIFLQLGYVQKIKWYQENRD